VTGLGGSAISIALGNYHGCAVLVRGGVKEDGKGGCWLCEYVCLDC